MKGLFRRAFADEWAAHYNFEAAAWASRRHRRLFARKSAMALRRARRLAAAGGTPPLSFGKVFKATTDKPFPLGEGLLAAALDAERTSARTYRRLGGKLGRKLRREAQREVRLLTAIISREPGRGAAKRLGVRRVPASPARGRRRRARRP